VKLRAFVAGSGDLRRIKDIVAEDFTEKKLTLPVVSTIQVGALPLTGAQVVIEAISSEKNVVNLNGLAFFSASESATPATAIAQLQTSTQNQRLPAGDILRVTCFLSSLDDEHSARSAVVAAFPSAVENFVQMQRQALEPKTLCEAVARWTGKPVADAPGSSSSHRRWC
jgi:enamine deaminase RidA (YjgF/YER057c/UK114 family)